MIEIETMDLSTPGRPERPGTLRKPRTSAKLDTLGTPGVHRGPKAILTMARGFVGGSFLLGIAYGSLVLGLTRCSLVVERDADQCSKDADCAALGASFTGTTCSTEHVCVKGGPVTVACTTNATCLSALQKPSICDKSAKSCVELITDDCDTVLANDGDLANDETVLFGLLSPITGDNDSTGIPQRAAVDLARQDIMGSTSGLPPLSATGKPRPIAFLACNDDKDPLGAAKHLAEVVKVPAIIGPAFSGVTLKVANGVTIPAGTLLMSTSATSTLITDLHDQGLVWRTSPPDTLQAGAITLLLSGRIEPLIRETAGQTPLKLAIINKGDGYGQALTSRLFDTITFNGKSVSDNDGDGNFLKKDYGNTDEMTDDQVATATAAAVTEVLPFKPDMVVIIGTTESVKQVFVGLEHGFDDTKKPFYVFADGGAVPEVGVVTGDATLAARDAQSRVLGTIPGTNNALYKSFVSQFKGRVSGSNPEVFGVAGAYDATFLFTYAATAAGANPITGKAMNEGLKKTADLNATIIKVGLDDLSDGLTAINAGGTINVDGTSGPLDFNVDTGEAPSDIQIWCATSHGPLISKAYFDAKLGTLNNLDQVPCPP